MRMHLGEPLTVADMAERVSLSPSAFAHLFRKVTGQSPYQFLKEMRLDKARELLIDGQFAVTRVSKEGGYGNVSHFIREFRARFGVTPRAYSDAHALYRELRIQRDGQAEETDSKTAARPDDGAFLNAAGLAYNLTGIRHVHWNAQ